jgi:hypothetical protein
MSYPVSEKAQIIQLVEQSHLPAKFTMACETLEVTTIVLIGTAY